MRQSDNNYPHRTTVYLTHEDRRLIRIQAVKEDKTMSSLISEIIKAYCHDKAASQ